MTTTLQAPVDIPPPAAPSATTEAPGVRRLTPETTTIFEGTLSVLHCSVKGQGLFRGVFAIRMFPVRHPSRFISLHYTDVSDKDLEIGVIEDLSVFPQDQQALVIRDLTAHYYEKVIRRVFDVRYEFGLLFFDVETQSGREHFVMPWRGDRAEEYGETGRVLLDALDNRYIIPDVEELPPADRQRFTSFIYW
ncbi:MAG: DUF1854 domain-containing protein [Lentisphaerae bacterium]|nr:DUF1854 domain-containing protein [Lentisphaerota bacterium]